MIEKETKLPAEKRIDFVSIVTPNYLYFSMIKSFLEEGFNIICDKPLVETIQEAEEICRIFKKQDAIFATAYCFTGYPMVKQTREMVCQGVLGKLQKVVMEYQHDYLLRLVEIQRKTRDDIWRMVPEKVGRSLCVSDIGTHAENLASHVTGLEIEKLNGVINSYTQWTDLDDEANILIKYQNGVRGILFCSVVAVGERNNLAIRVYGNKVALEWRELDYENLILQIPDEPVKVYKKDSSYLYPIAKYNIRFQVDTPDGHLDAFGNIYNHVANTLLAREEGRKLGELDLDFPTVFDGARGVYFINRAIDSGETEK